MEFLDRMPVAAGNTVRRAPRPGRRGRPPTPPARARPALTLAAPVLSTVPLNSLTAAPMADGMHGVLVENVGTAPKGVFAVTWVPTDTRARPARGTVLLAWEQHADGCDVTARLGLARSEVLLGVWPSLRGDWSDTVRPTVAEVLGIHSALDLATVLLECLVG
jgi:hypothetical protein